MYCHGKTVLAKSRRKPLLAKMGTKSEKATLLARNSDQQKLLDQAGWKLTPDLEEWFCLVTLLGFMIVLVLILVTAAVVKFALFCRRLHLIGPARLWAETVEDLQKPWFGHETNEGT